MESQEREIAAAEDEWKRRIALVEAQVQAETNLTERAKEQIRRDSLTIQDVQKKFVAERAKAEEKGTGSKNGSRRQGKGSK